MPFLAPTIELHDQLVRGLAFEVHDIDSGVAADQAADAFAGAVAGGYCYCCVAASKEKRCR